jgi:hypothetical protein
MTPSDVCEIFLHRERLHLGRAMSAYILARHVAAMTTTTSGGVPSRALPVIGDDARTGVPVRRVVELFSLLAEGLPVSAVPADRH